MEKDNKRHFTRVPFRSEVIVTTSSKRIRGIMEDLSLKGALVQVPEDIEVGSPVEIEIYLSEPASDLNVVLSGTIVRHTPAGLAVEFSGMYLDEYERLRDAVAKGVGNKQQVVEEFIKYMGR